MMDAVRESVRELIDTNPEGLSGADLSDMGWTELFDEDAELAVSALFDELGRAATHSDALDLLLIRTTLPAGDEPFAVIHPAPGTEGPAGVLRDGHVDADGLLLPGASQEGPFAVAVGERAAQRVVIIRQSESVNIASAGGIDPTSDYRRIAVRGAQVDQELTPPDGLTQTARRAVSLELLGIASRMLEVAADHVGSRVQFGRPLGANQAVRHRLADVHVGIEAARSAIQYSWVADAAELPLLSALGKSLASRAFDEANRHCLQVCGGMGFTTEFPLGRLIRRGIVLSALYGDTVQLAAEVGDHLIAGGHATRLSGFGGEEVA